MTSGPQIRVGNWNLFSYFSTKTYVVGTQKNRLDETVLLSTQNTCLNWWITGPMRVLDVKITCLLSITANCRISLLYQYKVCFVIFFFSMICWFYTVLMRVRDPKIGHGNQKLMPASYGIKFEKDLTSFNLLHLWNIMYLKILWKMEHLLFWSKCSIFHMFSNSWLISFNFLECFQCCLK